MILFAKNKVTSPVDQNERDNDGLHHDTGQQHHWRRHTGDAVLLSKGKIRGKFNLIILQINSCKMGQFCQFMAYEPHISKVFLVFKKIINSYFFAVWNSVVDITSDSQQFYNSNHMQSFTAIVDSIATKEFRING